MAHGGFHFTYEPDIYISGISPDIVPTGGEFLVTGSGVCSATGVRVSDGCGGCTYNVPFLTGFGHNGGYCVVTGTLPDISPEAFMTLEVMNTRSTGTYYPFEIVSSAPCIHNCEEVIITGNLTVTGDVSISGSIQGATPALSHAGLVYLNPPVNNILTGFLAVDGDGNVFQRQIDPTGTTGQYNPGGIVMIAGSGLIGGGDVTLSRRFDVGQGTGVHITADAVNVDTGVFMHTGAGFVDFHASVGLTGKFHTVSGSHVLAGYNMQSGRIFLGETINLGVAVDDDTIGFTGVSGDDLAVFTVMDNGISPDKVSFGFAGSNIKSGAANSVSGYISGGVGLNEFIWSGDSKQVINVDPTQVVMTTGDQVISGLKTFSGQVNISGLEVFGLLTATGDGIFVSDLRITGSVSGAMTMKSLNISGINFTDRYLTSEIVPPNPTQSDGLEIFNINYTAQEIGNYLILDTELNLSAKEICNATVSIFRDSETTPIRAWNQTIFTNNASDVFNMKYFHRAEDTDLHTYKIRVGRRSTRGYSPILYINRMQSWPDIYPYASGYLGDAAVSSFLISEIKPHPTGSRW
jgi:cytoskeletal protein CcmA (bactofilin family)